MSDKAGLIIEFVQAIELGADKDHYCNRCDNAYDCNPDAEPTQLCHGCAQDASDLLPTIFYELVKSQAENRRMGDTLKLLLAEYTYWRDQEIAGWEEQLTTLGAMAAISNVVAAIHGHPAPWHLHF